MDSKKSKQSISIATRVQGILSKPTYIEFKAYCSDNKISESSFVALAVEAKLRLIRAKNNS